ncbi:MarR family winged helix-turn-helix transcriptional regulator [Sneathiella glossodoripedis]|uniref:MarR family winged helix-turn-helix transcriptional regulator n=1 Tax=Sneathiella glossodoripedis TaxID=418853 RepID=UPI00131F1F27|nr:MarR family transcriptional regulator [Sneathiella glossodoripedis]
MTSKNILKKSEDAAHAPMDLGALEHNVGYYMRKSVLAAQSSFLRETGVKLMTGQYSVMEIIANNPGRTQSAIAWAAGLDRSSLVPILNQFEKNGFIRKEPVQNDKRAYAVSLTAEGEKELAELRVKVEEMEQVFIKGMGARNHKQLISLLGKFLETLKD